MEQDSKQAKPSFSIDSLLGKAVTSANQEIEFEDNDHSRKEHWILYSLLYIFLHSNE